MVMPKTRDLIAQASVSIKRTRRLLRDASRALKDAEAHLAELTEAEPAPEPAWVEDAKEEAGRVRLFLWKAHECHTNVHVLPDAAGRVSEVRVLLKDCVVWSRSEKGCTDIDSARVRGLLSDKWRDFL